MAKTYTDAQRQKIEELLELGNPNGALCTEIPHDLEDNPTRFQAEAEKIVSRNNSNSYLIFGKDRMGDIFSGFGGIGMPNSNAIDIVAGMGSSFEPVGKKTLTKETVVDPNPFTDAARVYISQRTNLDGHFGITEGELYPLDALQGVSGIAMKADSVLVLGRRNVKIKAGQSHGDGLPVGGEKDSHGTNLPDARIDIIADAPLEPMVRGDKMLECVKGIYTQIQENRTLIIQLVAQLLKLRTALMLHTHPTAGFVAFQSPELMGANVEEIPKDIEQLMIAINDMMSAAIEEMNCVVIPNKDKYILSKNVFTS